MALGLALTLEGGNVVVSNVVAGFLSLELRQQLPVGTCIVQVHAHVTMLDVSRITLWS
jgi:hypothetical protein